VANFAYTNFSGAIYTDAIFNGTTFANSDNCFNHKKCLNSTHPTTSRYLQARPDDSSA
jgi:hypothetical protein